MSAIAAIAVQIGVPLIEKILTNKIGGAGGELAADVLRNLADRAGTTPAGLEVLAETEPGRVIDAMRHVEKMTPELIALYAAGVQGQFALLQAEQADPAWMRAWRPAGMYMLGFLWLWNVVLLHVANAIWKIALPAVPFEVLFQVSALYMGLYMGGHTVKDVAEKWKAKA